MSESKSLERARFFSGKPLTGEDLALIQQYVREKLRRHNRTLHGFGIVSGLGVSVGSGQIMVDAGLALDCQGNELVIGTSQTLSPPAATESWRTAYLNIRYLEDSGDPMTIAEGEVLRIEERSELVVDSKNCNSGHRHVRARWLACGNPHPLTIAKLRHSSQGWRVDRRYRAPTVK